MLPLGASERVSSRVCEGQPAYDGVSAETSAERTRSAAGPSFTARALARLSLWLRYRYRYQSTCHWIYRDRTSYLVIVCRPP